MIEVTPWIKSLPASPFPLNDWKDYLQSMTRETPPAGWHYLAGPFNRAETVELIHIVAEMIRGDIDYCIIEDRSGNRKVYRTGEGWLRGDLHLQIDDEEDV